MTNKLTSLVLSFLVSTLLYCGLASPPPAFADTKHVYPSTSTASPAAEEVPVPGYEPGTKCCDYHEVSYTPGLGQVGYYTRRECDHASEIVDSGCPGPWDSTPVFE